MGKVIFVDDSNGLPRSFKRKFAPFFDIETCESGAEALELLDKSGSEFSVMVTDMKMPVMDGLQLLKKVKELHPHIKGIVQTGYSNFNNIIEALNVGEIEAYFEKPWRDIDFMKDKIARCIYLSEKKQNEAKLIKVEIVK
jgi:two-component system response regulator HupR/HoxA